MRLFKRKRKMLSPDEAQELYELYLFLESLPKVKIK